MAGGAVIHDARMIEHARSKATGFMTDTAILGGRHMVGLLAHGRHTVVA